MSLRRNTAVVGVANLLSRLSGLAREVAFAAAFGAGIGADAYNAAFRIGTLFRELFAEGALSNAFVPLYADVREREGAASAWRLANAFLGVILALVGGVTVFTVLAAGALVTLVAGGYSDEKAALTATLTRVMAPFIATVAAAAVFVGMQNVGGRFFWPAASPVLFNLLIVAACLGAAPFERATGLPGIHAMAWGTLLGGLAQMAVQLPALWKEGFRLRPTLGGHPALGRLLAFVGPALVAISVVQVSLLIETQLASRVGDGAVSWLLYAFRVAHLPISIVSVAVGVAALAGLSVHAARGDTDAFRRDLVGGLNLNTFLMLPAAVGMGLLATPLVAILFERGAFTPEDTAATALVVQGYALAALGIGAQRILVPVFYALGDPRTPMWAGLGALALKLPVALVLMAWTGLAGLPLSHAVLVSGEVIVLLAVLERRVPGVIRMLAGFHVRSVTAVAVMGGALALGAPRIDRVTLLPAVLVCGALYFAAAELLGIRELRRLVQRERGLPPSVDAETRRLLALAARSPVRLDGDRIVLPDRTLLLGVRDGALVATESPGGAEGLAPERLVAVLRVGNPPVLVGLRVGERTVRVEREAVVEGQVVGVDVRLG
jgi:putative peptidoglycan lipid II flippase